MPADFRARLEAWQIRSPVVKFNAALKRLPTFRAAADAMWPYRSMISVTPGLDAAEEAFADCEAGVANVGYGEVYFQTGYDPSPAPEGRHLMSVFGQYAPYTLASGSWDEQRDAIGKQFVDLIARFARTSGTASSSARCSAHPTSRTVFGLTGGHIFQGETMPDQMWEHRLTSRTPIPGFYFCGVSTHPAGSVIVLNGRNAAQAALADDA